MAEPSDSDKERKETNRKAIETILHVCENVVARQRRSGDPVIRATLLVDKLSLLVDIGVATVINTNTDLPEETVARIRHSTNLLNDELQFLSDWISTPVYSPDHPYGNKSCKPVKNNFNESSNSSNR